MIMLLSNKYFVNNSILITGVAGFIGYHLANRLLNDLKGVRVIGVDSLNDYYDLRLKNYRIDLLKKYENFDFRRIDISNKTELDNIFVLERPSVVINLAAQAGMRYSISHPQSYMDSNVIGFYNILEACRHSYDNGESGVNHLVFASSSSVYGVNSVIPYSTEEKVDCPVNFYAATKRCDELFAYSYSKLYGIPCTGLRFFTVYGPMGRPDMAYFDFTNKLKRGEKIPLFNYGKSKRDFTYVDDIVEGICRVILHAPKSINAENDNASAPYKLYNIGRGEPVDLLDFVTILHEELKAVGVLPCNLDINNYIDLYPMQKGDVAVTYADTTSFEQDFNFKPTISLREGLHKFAQWYADYY